MIDLGWILIRDVFTGVFIVLMTKVVFFEAWIELGWFLFGT